MDQDVKILCVDDEANVLKALERLFMDEDYEIITAESGKAGLEILEQESPIQLVVSDYRMPEMDGVDFLKQVCDRWPDTVRIVLSGYADTAAIVDAINEGKIYKFIAKPWNDDELKVTIATAVDLYFLQEKNILLTEELAQANEELQILNNNLEETVKKRTEEVLFQNEVLTRAHYLLDSLPVGVLGLDDNGMIAQCNKQGINFLGMEGTALMGVIAEDVFPSELLDCVAKVRAEKKCAEHINLAGHAVRIKGSLMDNCEGQQGLVLVLDQGAEE